MNPYKNIISHFRGKRILVIGDVILDQHIQGSVSRISQEAPVPVVLQQGEPSFAPGGAANVAHNLRNLKADVLLVAMGNPKQELFIQEHLAATGCIVGMGVGALFDFLAGNVPRAMPRVRRWRLEWVYRLIQEPRRLAGRYLVGIPLFLMRLLRQWWSGSRLNDAGSFGGGDHAILRGENAAIDRDIAA